MTKTQNQSSLGHLLALFTIVVWGTTFISTKVLLRTFSPVEIMFSRFLIGFVLLLLFSPKPLRLQSKRQEWLFVGAGLSGITLYCLLENIALTLSSASNVSIVVTIAPFFTALLSGWVLKAEKPRPQFYVGFAAAITGVVLISYNGSSALQLNPLGDLLALLAAMTWAVYSILTRKIGQLGHSTIQTTRHIFFYGLLFMLPTLFFMDFPAMLKGFTNPVNLGNILFLGAGASALCFVTWNTAMKILGAIKTSVYIYLVPVVTVATSVLVLREPLTPVLILGAALTLAGLWLSETKLFDRKEVLS